MKKRKELDALLLINMNGKKSGKHSNGKEAHELLRNDISWDSNSTENEELFAPPKKPRIRKPHRWQICASCLPMCVIVILVASVVVAGGLVWMHLNLKQDLDELRLRIAQVDSSLETSTEQAATVSRLQEKIEELLRVPAEVTDNGGRIDDLYLKNTQLETQVKAARDEVKDLPTLKLDDLSQTIAQIGSKVHTMQELQGEHTLGMKTITNSIEQLQSSLAMLQAEISEMSHPSSTGNPPLEHETSKPRLDHSSPATTASPIIDLSTALVSIQQRLDDLTSAVHVIDTWRADVTPRIAILELRHQASPTTTKTTPIQAPVSASNAHNESTTTVTPGNQPSDAQNAWRQQMESRVQTMQNRLDELNPNDLNNNLLSPNVTRGLQHQLERSLGKFKEENLRSGQVLLHRLFQQHGDILDLQDDLQRLAGRVQALKNGTGDVPPTKATTDILRDLTPAQHPIKITGIDTVEALNFQFFLWDANDDGFVNFAEIRDGLGSNTPTEEQLMQYDYDLSGALDLREMETALGF